MIKWYCDGCGKEVKNPSDLIALLWNEFDIRDKDKYGSFCEDCRKTITKALKPVLKELGDKKE